MGSLLRTTLVAVILAGVILAGFWRFMLDEKQRAIDELRQISDEMQQRLEARQAMIDRLGRSRRVAHVRITAQRDLADSALGHTVESDLELIELDDAGGEIGRQSFTIPGDVLFIDGWTVKFDAEHVAQGDPFRGRTLLLLRRVYSDRMPAIEGFVIDTPGAVPPAYAVGELGRFEMQLWKSFWEIASDWKLAREMGVRVAQGEAVYKPVRPGQVFELVLDAVGGMSLTPIDPAAVDDAFANADAPHEPHADERKIPR